MANVYVRNGAAGAGTGADWANAYTTLAAALTAKSAGDDFWVSDDHAETQASAMTCTSPGTAASPCRIVCVNHSGTVPPVSADLRTTATVSTTGASAVTLNGVAYCYGVAFQAGNSSNNASLSVSQTASDFWYFDTCTLKLNNTNTNSRVAVGTAAGGVLAHMGAWLVNCTVNLGAAGQFLLVAGQLVWQGGSVAGTAPTALFSGPSGPVRYGTAKLLGVDLSNVTGTLFSQTSTYLVSAVLVDCRLGSGVAFSSGTHPGPGIGEILAVNCDSTSHNYRYYRETYFGSEQQETTVVRAGGATDGVTPVSRKVITSANTKQYAPYQGDWMLFWNAATGSAITVAIPVVTDNVTLNQTDAWVEVEYLGSSSFPAGTIDATSDGPADPLVVAAAQTTDSTSLWPSAPGAPVKQILSASVTPQMAGFCRARVVVARASTTLYYDPAPVNGVWSKYGSGQFASDGGIVNFPNNPLVSRATITRGQQSY